MNKREALIAALNGAKVRRPLWNRGEYICFAGGGFCDETEDFVCINDLGQPDDDTWYIHSRPTTLPVAEELDLSAPEPQEAVQLPFGTGELLLSRGHSDSGFLIGIERSPFGPMPIGTTVLHEEPLQFVAEMCFPTESQRDAVVNAMLDRSPSELCKYCGRPSNVDPSDQTPPVDTCGEENHGTDVLLDVLRANGETIRKIISEPKRPDCEEQFRKWYWESGSELNPNSARLVWHAAQHAVHVAMLVAATRKSDE